MQFKHTALTITLLASSIISNNIFCAGNVIELSGTQSSNQINVEADIVKGSGTLDGNDISIDCDEFQFTGTIRCNKSCKINAKKAFNHGIFKREGSGTFNITSPQDAAAQIAQEGTFKLWKVAAGFAVVAAAAIAYYWVTQPAEIESNAPNKPKPARIV